MGIDVELLGVAADSAFVQGLVAASTEMPYINWNDSWGEYYWLRHTGAWSDGKAHPTGHHLALNQMLEAHPELSILTWNPNMRQGGFIELLADVLHPLDASEVVYGSLTIGRTSQVGVSYNSPALVARAAARLENLSLEVLPTTDINPGFDEGHVAVTPSDWKNAELMRFRNFYLAAAQLGAGVVINT